MNSSRLNNTTSQGEMSFEMALKKNVKQIN